MNKKFKVRPVDMCIYIDKHAYEKDHDVELIFEYLQDLFYALSKKKRFFSKEKDYEDYSLYGATHVYQRLTNPKQFIEDENKRLPRIKSVLNYIKHILYPLKVNYQTENFGGVISDNYQGDGIEQIIFNDLKKNVQDSNSGLVKVEVENYFTYLPRLIKQFLLESPYANNKITFMNLYISCLITILRSITLSNDNYNRLINKDTNELKLNADEYLEKYYYEEALTAPIN